MARAPRSITIAPRNDDPIDDAVRDDKANVADALMIELEKLGGIEQGSIKGILYRIPVPNGKYEWIREVFPPFDMSEIMQSLKDEIGGGDYAMRLMAEGKVRKTLHFSIMKTVQSLVAQKKDDTDSMLTLFQIMNSQSQASADRQAQMMMAMQNQSRESSDRQMTMMMTMMTAMMGSSTKPTDLITMITAMNAGGGEKTGLKDMVETLAVLKGLTDPAKESAFNADDIVGSVLKIAGPVAGAVGRAASGMMEGRRQNQAQPIQLQEHPQAGLEFPTLPNPSQTALPSPVSGPDPAGGPAALIALIRPDVNYFFGRRHDVELAAEAVYGVINAALDNGQVSEDDLNDMVTAFMGSPDWISELAGAGIDLRGDPAWAQSFLFALITEHTNAESDPGGEPLVSEGNEHSGRPNGSGPDLGSNGQAGAAGLNFHEGPPASGQSDDARV